MSLSHLFDPKGGKRKNKKFVQFSRTIWTGSIFLVGDTKSALNQFAAAAAAAADKAIDSRTLVSESEDD